MYFFCPLLHSVRCFLGMLLTSRIFSNPQSRRWLPPIGHNKEHQRVFHGSHCEREQNDGCPTRLSPNPQKKAQSMSLNLGVDLSTVSLDGSFDVKVYLAGAKDVFPHVNQITSNPEPKVQGSPDDFLAQKGESAEKFRYQMKNKVEQGAFVNDMFRFVNVLPVLRRWPLLWLRATVVDMI